MTKIKIPIKKLPRHVALIMDGNLRWAKANKLHYIEGLRQGAQVIKPLVKRAADMGIKHITFWALSTENWKRGKKFTNALFKVFREFFKKVELFDELYQAGGKINIWGDITEFPQNIQDEINKHVLRQPSKKKIDVNFCLNYGGRTEIIRVVKQLLKNAFSSEEMNEKKFSHYLYTKDQPDPDLIIRTSGEKRLSGFMPWQSIYSELYFPLVFWPDFTPEEFDKAIIEYSQRERRFGRQSSN